MFCDVGVYMVAFWAFVVVFPVMVLGCRLLRTVVEVVLLCFGFFVLGVWGVITLSDFDVLRVG